jgi:hypothetical protein
LKAPKKKTPVEQQKFEAQGEQVFIGRPEDDFILTGRALLGVDAFPARRATAGASG